MFRRGETDYVKSIGFETGMDQNMQARRRHLRLGHQTVRPVTQEMCGIVSIAFGDLRLQISCQTRQNRRLSDHPFYRLLKQRLDRASVKKPL